MGNLVRAKDLRQRSEEELQTFIRERREEIWKLKFQHYTGQLENVTRVTTAKRELARALTIAKERANT